MTSGFQLTSKLFSVILLELFDMKLLAELSVA